MTEHETPVLVAGGSLVGMFMAALLARQGIHPLVVERHPGSAIHPRAAMIYQRTMEIIRSLGIEDAVRQDARLSKEQKAILDQFRETETGDECPASKGFFSRIREALGG